ncbi:MAG: hypothetical protein ACTSUP_08865 [Candidatus Heimdallarchaeaceae archaeon]|nr:hypothetical protein [Candidatus Heimdallarchaeota archaeon]
MVNEKPTLKIYCKFCEKECAQDFIGENRKDTFSLTFVCKVCGSYHTFEFFGSQFEQPTELD